MARRSEFAKSLIALRKQVSRQQWDNNWWQPDAEKRLKYLSGEVLELACVPSADDGHSLKWVDKRRAEEAMDCLWNVLAFLNEQRISDKHVGEALDRLLARKAGKE